MQSGTILDEQISASSQRDDNYAANQGRLHFQATGALKGAWSAGSNDAYQWLQVYLGCEFFIITAIATQGRNGCCSQWVITYNLHYSDNMTNFQYYREQGGSIKVTRITPDTSRTYFVSRFYLNAAVILNNKAYYRLSSL